MFHLHVVSLWICCLMLESRLKAARSAAKAATSLAKGQPLSQAWSHCFTLGAKDWSDKTKIAGGRVQEDCVSRCVCVCVTELPLFGVWTGKICVF